MSNRFLRTPAAHRSVQNWTHLPKIGDVCFLGQPNFGLSFSWRKIALPVGGGKFRSPLPQWFFAKIRKNAGAIKTEFSTLTQDVRSFAHIYPHNLFHNFVIAFFVPSQIPHKWGKGHVLSPPKSEKQNLSSVFGRKYFCTKMSERAGIRHWQGVNVLFTAGYKTAKMTV